MRHLLLPFMAAPFTASLAAGPAGPTAAAVSESLGGIAVSAVSAVPEVAGLYAVRTEEGTVLYVDATGRYALQGPLVELATRRNLSQELLLRDQKVDFAQVPLQAAMTRRKGNGSRRLVVLADPECPYCVQLEASLRELDDVTIYVLPYPLESVHPGATALSRDLWCSSDPGLAWEKWMTEPRVKPAAAATSCAAPIAEVRAYAERIQANGTPTLLFPSGRMAVGALDAVTIEAYLDEPPAR